jgi:hypothetical protein
MHNSDANTSEFQPRFTLFTLHKGTKKINITNKPCKSANKPLELSQKHDKDLLYLLQDSDTIPELGRRTITGDAATWGGTAGGSWLGSCEAAGSGCPTTVWSGRGDGARRTKAPIARTRRHASHCNSCHSLHLEARSRRRKRPPWRHKQRWPRKHRRCRHRAQAPPRASTAGHEREHTQHRHTTSAPTTMAGQEKQGSCRSGPPRLAPKALYLRPPAKPPPQRRPPERRGRATTANLRFRPNIWTFLSGKMPDYGGYCPTLLYTFHYYGWTSPPPLSTGIAGERASVQTTSLGSTTLGTVARREKVWGRMRVCRRT